MAAIKAEFLLKELKSKKIYLCLEQQLQTMYFI